MIGKTRSVIAALMFLTAAGCATTEVVDSPDLYQTRPDGSPGDTGAAEAKNAAAIDLMDAGEHDGAAQLLREALTADVMYGPAHNSLGRVYYEQGRYYLAAWEFEYAVKLMPGVPEPRNNLGLVFETVDRLDRAVAYYREARQMEPDNPQIIGNLVRARLKRGDRGDDVRELLRELIYKDTRPQWVEWARQKLALLD